MFRKAYPSHHVNWESLTCAWLLFVCSINASFFPIDNNEEITVQISINGQFFLLCKETSTAKQAKEECENLHPGISEAFNPKTNDEVTIMQEALRRVDGSDAPYWMPSRLSNGKRSWKDEDVSIMMLQNPGVLDCSYVRANSIMSLYESDCGNRYQFICILEDPEGHSNDERLQYPANIKVYSKRSPSPSPSPSYSSRFLDTATPITSHSTITVCNPLPNNTTNTTTTTNSTSSTLTNYTTTQTPDSKDEPKEDDTDENPETTPPSSSPPSSSSSSSSNTTSAHLTSQELTTPSFTCYEIEIESTMIEPTTTPSLGDIIQYTSWLFENSLDASGESFETVYLSESFETAYSSEDYFETVYLSEDYFETVYSNEDYFETVYSSEDYFETSIASGYDDIASTPTTENSETVSSRMTSGHSLLPQSTTPKPPVATKRTTKRPTETPTTHGTQTQTCPCKCSNANPLSATKNMTLGEVIRELTTTIKKNLTVDTSSLSSTIRLKTSAYDARPSSKLTGILGVIFLVLIFGSIVIMDLVQLVVHLLCSH